MLMEFQYQSFPWVWFNNESVYTEYGKRSWGCGAKALALSAHINSLLVAILQTRDRMNAITDLVLHVVRYIYYMWPNVASSKELLCLVLLLRTSMVLSNEYNKRNLWLQLTAISDRKYKKSMLIEISNDWVGVYKTVILGKIDEKVDWKYPLNNKILGTCFFLWYSFLPW